MISFAVFYVRHLTFQEVKVSDFCEDHLFYSYLHCSIIIHNPRALHCLSKLYITAGKTLKNILIILQQLFLETNVTSLLRFLSSVCRRYICLLYDWHLCLFIYDTSDDI